MCTCAFSLFVVDEELLSGESKLTAPSADCLVCSPILHLSLSWIPKTFVSVQFLYFSISCSFYYKYIINMNTIIKNSLGKIKAQ
jgi:hypothetical protein